MLDESWCNNLRDSFFIRLFGKPNMTMKEINENPDPDATVFADEIYMSGDPSDAEFIHVVRKGVAAEDFAMNIRGTPVPGVASGSGSRGESGEPIGAPPPSGGTAGGTLSGAAKRRKRRHRSGAAAEEPAEGEEYEPEEGTYAAPAVPAPIASRTRSHDLPGDDVGSGSAAPLPDSATRGRERTHQAGKGRQGERFHGEHGDDRSRSDRKGDQRPEKGAGRGRGRGKGRR